MSSRWEFKKNHGEWVSTVRPNLGPGISDRVREAFETTDENIDVCRSVKKELHEALAALLGVMFPLLSLHLPHCFLDHHFNSML